MISQTYNGKFLTGLEYFCLAGFVFLILFLPFNAKGADFSVVINEIAWMGTAASANDEWIEPTIQPIVSAYL